MSAGKVTSIIQPASIGKGRENVSLNVVFSLTTLVVIADVEPEAIVAGVDTCIDVLEESISPPFEAVVVIVIPVRGAVDMGFLTLETEKLTSALGAIVVL